MNSVQQDAPFVHISTKERAIAWISKTFFDGVTYRARHGLTKGMVRRGGMGWLPEFLAGDDTAEITFLRSLDLQNKVVYDIGAFHGLLTIWFASVASKVFAFEPNSASRERLTENVALNRLDNVTIRRAALGSRPGGYTMRWDSLVPGMAKIGGQGKHAEAIVMSTLDQEAQTPPDFIKIDTEGFEADVLRGAQKTLERHPEVFLEVHGETMRQKRINAAEIVGILTAGGYTAILHVENSILITPSNSDQAARGHIYACRPDSAGRGA